MTFRSLLGICFFLLLQSCSITRLPEDLGYGVLNSDDLETVRDGLPTYLLLVDGALITYPKNKSLLLASSNLNSAYGGVFVTDELRKFKLIDKSFQHAKRAFCLHKKKGCEIQSMKFDAFEQLVSGMKKEKDLPYLYALGSAWTSYIQLTSDDYNSIAELARVDLLMRQIIKVSPSFENGMPLVYLGALNSLIPPSLGGKPEVAKQFFEQAIEVSEGKNLIAKVLFAEKYARLMFDQELHDQLLKEVLGAESKVYGLTLQNEFAKTEAKRLLKESPEYF